MEQTSTLISQIVEAWTKLQSQQPLVQCITNSVAANYVANILLAANASPAMIDNPFESESFTTIANALSINLGTPTSEQTQAMLISAETAHKTQTPWVLDPVGYSSILKWRSEITNALLKFKPSVIRGNASEIITLAGHQVESKGVDSTLTSAEAYVQAKSLLQYTDCVAISGESDYILSNELNAVIRVNGGSYLQPKITATGCALGALIAAYCAVATPAIGTVAAHVHFAIAGKLAHDQSNTIGSFGIEFLDYVHTLNEDLIRHYANLEILDA